MDKDEPVDIDDLRDMMQTSGGDADEKPCGNFHPLPCGLDKECDVPVEEFDADKSSVEIFDGWKDWNWRVESPVWIAPDDT